MEKTKNLYNELNDLDIITNYEYPVLILKDINNIINNIISNLNKEEYDIINENIYVHKSCEIGKSVEIIGPCVIMENTKILHNAYIRGNVIIGKNSYIANSSEIKNSILIGNNKIPHFNYVGDSILGNGVHLGAGAIISNLRFDKQNIKVQGEQTDLLKIGAFIGDNTEIGCNSVIAPGSVIEANTIVYPLIFYRNKNIIERL